MHALAGQRYIRIMRSPSKMICFLFEKITLNIRNLSLKILKRVHHKFPTLIIMQILLEISDKTKWTLRKGNFNN